MQTPLDPKRFYKLTIVNQKKEEPDLSVKKVFIRRNVWDNYGAFVGSRKMIDGADKGDLLDYCRELWPNAEIIDRTI